MNSHNPSRLLVSSVALLALVGLTGCPDARGRFDEFNGRVLDAPPDYDAPPLPDAPPLAQIPDITGRFLLGIEPVIAPTLILQFINENTMTDNGDGTATLNLTLVCLTVTDRTPVGDTKTSTAQVDSAGRFEASFPNVTVPGSANPVSGATLVGDFVLAGTIRSENLACGDAGGKLTSPYELNLTGSTFGTIRIGADTIGAALPPPTFKCPAEAPADAGVPDATETPDADETPDAT